MKRAIKRLLRCLNFSTMDGAEPGTGSTNEMDAYHSKEKMLLQSKEQANAHWAYVEETLRTHGISEGDLILCRFHYKAAMKHGFKHGWEFAYECKH